MVGLVSMQSVATIMAKAKINVAEVESLQMVKQSVITVLIVTLKQVGNQEDILVLN